MDHLLVRDVTILTRPAGTEARAGYLEFDWSAATETSVKGWLARTATQEVADRRQAEVSEWLLHLPAGTVITGVDRVVIDGATYEVAGPPNRAWTPRGEHHVEVALRHVAG